MNMFSFRLVVAIALAGSAAAFGQTPVGVAFTYQGRLESGGAPPSGFFDFQFKLFDAATGGVQQGSTLQFDGVGNDPAPLAVASGLFTVTLDFGSQFAGAA